MRNVEHRGTKIRIFHKGREGSIQLVLYVMETNLTFEVIQNDRMTYCACLLFSLKHYPHDLQYYVY